MYSFKIQCCKILVDLLYFSDNCLFVESPQEEEEYDDEEEPWMTREELLEMYQVCLFVSLFRRSSLQGNSANFQLGM